MLKPPPANGSPVEGSWIFFAFLGVNKGPSSASSYPQTTAMVSRAVLRHDIKSSKRSSQSSEMTAADAREQRRELQIEFEEQASRGAQSPTCIPRFSPP